VPAFALTFGPGPGWDPALPRRGQPEWDAHAAFMDHLVEEGFVLLGGPVGDDGRVLLAVEAADAAEVRSRLAEDPWEPLGILRLERLEPWSLWLDGRRRTGQG
jgi:uncharacterized protein YciI